MSVPPWVRRKPISIKVKLLIINYSPVRDPNLFLTQAQSPRTLNLLALALMLCFRTTYITDWKGICILNVNLVVFYFCWTKNVRNKCSSLLCSCELIKLLFQVKQPSATCQPGKCFHGSSQTSPFTQYLQPLFMVS